MLTVNNSKTQDVQQVLNVMGRKSPWQLANRG